MFITIKDMNGHEIKLHRPYGIQWGLEIDLKLNDGSDPTEIRLQFNQEGTNTLYNALSFFS